MGHTKSQNMATDDFKSATEKFFWVREMKLTYGVPGFTRAIESEGSGVVVPLTSKVPNVFS